MAEGLDAKTAKAVDEMLERANGKRRKHLLGVDDVARVIREAMANPHGIAVRHGGAEIMGKTSLAIGVKPEKRDGVVVGIGQCWADRPTPGRVWQELGPWQQDFARNVVKARAWAEVKRPDRIFVPAGKAAKPAAAKGGRGDGAALLAQVLANPADDGARMVYSDWLLERNDPRGELIAVQCALATTPPAKRRALVKREQELIKKHGREWTREAMQIAIECELRRGFVAQVKCTAAAFANNGAALFGHDPIETLVLSKPTGAGVKLLGAAPHLARLRRFEFSSPYWMQSERDVKELRGFFQSKHLGKVPEIAMGLQHDRYLSTMPAIADLFDGIAWPGVQHFEIYVDGGAESYASLARAKLPALKRLVIHAKQPALLASLKAAFPKAKIGPP